MQKVLFVLAGAVIMWGCQKDPDNLKLYDEMVVSTNFDREANFGSYITYAIPKDTIGFYSNSSNDTIMVAKAENRYYPRTVLNRVMENMNDRQYTKVDRNQNPDVGVNVYIVNDLNLFQQVVYPSYYYPYYYGYGSYYSYPYVNTYAYNTGSLVIELVDLKNVTPDNKVKVIWSAYMGDVYSTIDLEEQSVEAIDQAFIQSNYLDHAN